MNNTMPSEMKMDEVEKTYYKMSRQPAAVDKENESTGFYLFDIKHKTD